MTETSATNPVEDADTYAASRSEVESHVAHVDETPTEEAQGAGEEAEAGHTSDADPEGQAEAGDVEVEYEGQKFKVPAALKDAVLRQADYTRKTQAVAEAARQVQAAQADFERERQASLAALDEEIADRTTVHSLRQQLDAWKTVNWQLLEDHDRENGTQELASALRRHTALKDALAAAEETLRGKQSTREAKETAARQRLEATEAEEDTKQLEAGLRHLTEKIPDWSTVAPQVARFGQERFGFTTAELAAVRDPRMFEVLHLAMVGAKSVAASTTAARTAAATSIKPVPQVGGGRSAPTRDMSRLPTDEWMRARQQQIAEKRKRK